MKHISPVFIFVDSEKLVKLISAHANSGGGCGFLGCPKPADYQSGGGCGHLYSIGGCDIKHNTSY